MSAKGMSTGTAVSKLGCSILGLLFGALALAIIGAFLYVLWSTPLS